MSSTVFVCKNPQAIVQVLMQRGFWLADECSSWYPWHDGSQRYNPVFVWQVLYEGESYSETIIGYHVL